MAVRRPRLLDGSMKELARLNPASLTLEEHLSPLSTARMVLPEGDCGAETGQFVALYTSHGSAGIYRVQQSEQDWGGRVTLSLEHGLTTLGDGIMPGEGEQSGTVRQLVAGILSHQPKVMWVLGRVAVPDTLTLTWRNDNANLLESLCGLLDELPGYCLTFDQSVFPWVLHIDALSGEDGCECRLHRNLSSLRVEEDRSDLCTRLYVNGLTSPLDADTIGTYGIVTRYMDADPAMGVEELTRQGQAYLATHREPAISVTMDAVDWYESTGEPFDRFTLGRVCRVCLPDCGRAIRQRVIGLSWPDVYGQPDQVTVKLASESTTAVSVMAGLIIDTTVTRRRLTSDMRSQKALVLAAEEQITLMAREVAVNAEQINLKASSEEVGELTRRVSAAEIAMDGVNAEIGLKVSRDGVVSAINLSPEGVKISASKIELSGNVIAGYLNGTSIDVNELSASMVYASGGIQAPGATIDGAYIGALDCDSLTIGGTGYSARSKTVVVGQQTLTPSYVTIQYKDHNGNNQYQQVVKAVTISNAGTSTISYLGV